jgi:hypothetical protein
MQAVSKAKDKIKRFRRRNSSTGSVLHHHHHGDRHSSCDPHDSDLPPPYTENPPPVNPFYNDVGGGRGNRSRSFDYEYHRDEVSATVSPVLPSHATVSAPQYSPLGHPPLYPVLNSPDQHMYQNNIPPYSPPPEGNGGAPHTPHSTAGSHVNSRRPTYRNTSPNTEMSSHMVGSRTRLVRRSSCFSDAEDITEAISNINLSIGRSPHQS